LRVVDKLIIGVALDTGKEPVFDLAFRGKLVQADVDSLGAEGKRVEVKTFSGLLVNFAEENGANLIIRGIRAVSDYEYEFQIFLTASEDTHFISSRFVKQIARLGGDISSFVSPNVAKHLKAHSG